MKRTPMQSVVAWAVVNEMGWISLSSIRMNRGDAGYAYNYRATLGAKARRRGVRFARVEITEVKRRSTRSSE